MSHYCLKCGTMLQLQKLEKRWREVCPCCGWVYYLQLKVGAGVLIEQDGKLLLLRREQDPWAGYWNIPAGYVEADEPPEKAAEREAEEETGLQVQVTQFLKMYYYHDDPRGNGVMLIYACQPVGGSLHGSQEAYETRFFALIEIPEKLAGGAQDVIIRDWVRRKQSSVG